MLECIAAMEASNDGPRELEAQLEMQMRAQERQLTLARLVLCALAAVLLFALMARDTAGASLLLAIVAALAAWSVGVPALLRRFPSREVGIVSTVIEMAAVTTAVYAVPSAPDLYLFYGLVILGAALRFGLGAAIWSSIVMSAMYVSVVMVGGTLDRPAIEVLPVRVAYLVGFGAVAGMFSRIVIRRVNENARLQLRVAEEDRLRESTRERELLSRLGRDFNQSLDLSATYEAIAAGAGPILGDATMVFGADDAERRLEPAAASGPDAALAAAWRGWAAERPPRLGEGAIGAAGATASAQEARNDDALAGDAAGMRTLGLAWILAVPILAGGRLHGVLATAGRDARGPGDGMLRLAEAVAERAGPALQNAQLWSDLQERMAREQAATRIKDDFLSIVSHELRTPLTSIQGYSQLLEARLAGGFDPESKEMAHLHVILSQVGRMRRLVDDLLDVSRIDRRGAVSIEPGDFDLADLVREAVARVQREHPTRSISLEVGEGMTIHADRDRIDQVLSNLLENAVKYSPDGGPVVVRAGGRGGEVEVTVSDTGIGISPEHRENVFERFYQADGDAGRRRFGGLGLGLYISRAIIDAHGGRIWSGPNPEADSGSVFGFRLPRVSIGLAPPAIAPGGEPPAFVVRRREP
ncbi:MAG: HAMP domain-containing histidine kinase [Chloroflexi bacterium]|nr:HAMP domain-containing histidine kinase [Chloroflexota bacterium]